MDALNYENQFLDERVREAMRCIYNTEGDNCSPWVRPQHVYGRRSDLDVATGWKLVSPLSDDPSYPATNLINTIVSDDADDDQTIKIDGLTIDGEGKFTAVTQTAVLNGISGVTLTTPLARVLKMRNISSTPIEGTVVVKESVAGTVHLSIVGDVNQSQKCAWTTADNEYMLIKQMGCTSANATDSKYLTRFSVQWQNIPSGLVFVRHSPFITLTDQMPYVNMDIDPILVIPPNSDIRVLAETTLDDSEVGAWLNMVLATIVSSGE